MFLAPNIKYLRKRENLSQEEFARLFDLKRSNIGSYEEGRATPPLHIILKVARHFNIKIESLIQDDISQLNEFLTPIEYNQKDATSITYTPDEISVMAFKSHPASKALEDMLVSAIAMLAGKIRDGMDAMILEKVPQMIAKRYKELVSPDENVSIATRERFLQDLKKKMEIE